MIKVRVTKNIIRKNEVVFGLNISQVVVAAAGIAVGLIEGFLLNGKVSTDTLAAPIILAALCGILVAALCGVFNGFLVAKLNIQPMVATLILFTAGRGIAQLVTSGQITYVRVESYKTMGGFLGPIPTPVLFAIGAVIVAYLVLNKTALGMYIESVGINSRASRLVGLNSTRIKFLTYVIVVRWQDWPVSLLPAVSTQQMPTTLV